MNSANAQLTIIGLGVERFVTATSTNLFSIDGSNASLTLGRNITLQGYVASGYGAVPMILVQRGSLTMHDGSKITGYSAMESCVVLIEGENAGFKMNGGEISGNTDNISNGGSVYVIAGGTFEMSGGSIIGNNYKADIFIDDTNCKFLLSGNAEIGTLILYANNNTTCSYIIINGNYSGTVTTLHLAGTNDSASTVANFWTNAQVIVNGTTNVISMFNNGGLGNFRPRNTRGIIEEGTSIRTTHELNDVGELVLK